MSLHPDTGGKNSLSGTIDIQMNLVILLHTKHPSFLQCTSLYLTQPICSVSEIFTLQMHLTADIEFCAAEAETGGAMSCHHVHSL